MAYRERRRPPIPTRLTWCDCPGCGLLAEIELCWFTNAAEEQIIEDDIDEAIALITAPEFLNDRAQERLAHEARWRGAHPSRINLCRGDARAIWVTLKNRAKRERLPPPWYRELATPATVGGFPRE